MRLWRLLIVIAAMFATEASAQETGKLDLIQRMVLDAMEMDLSQDKGGWLNQMYGLSGREDLIVLAEKPGVCVAEQGDAVATIVERARATNIVIINEAHASPRDRHFIGQVLTALKGEGYTTYAAETFMPGLNLDHEGILARDGFYLNDAIFARTLTLAKALGYRLIAYESTKEQDEDIKQAHPEETQINRREIAETENLMRLVFDAAPDAKVVIHVGHAHVWERKHPAFEGPEIWMAQRLKARTGRDPLTIDQTMCLSTTGDTVVASARVMANGTVEPPQMVDLFVGHPQLEFRNGRVSWRQDLGERIAPVPQQFLGRDVPILIEARPPEAESEIVPTDRLLLRPGETLPLLLPVGRYRIEGFTRDGPIDAPPVLLDID